MRAALLTNILTPYRVPVYRALAGDDLHWRIFTNAETEFDRSWSVDAFALDVERVASLSIRRSFAFGGRHASQRTTTHLPVGLLASLRRFSPDVVVSAELGPRTALAWLYCRAFGVPLVIWSYHSRASATCGRGLRALRQTLLGAADAVVGMGAQARCVLRDYGVADAKLFDAPNAHHVESLRAALDGAEPDALRNWLVESQGLRTRLALVVGRLVPAKGIGPLLAAWDRVPEAVRAQSSLLFLGDGPLAPAIARAARRRDRGEIVQLPAVAPPEVASFYAAADLLVFPSLGDPWGLVVNEAMACATPVLCSIRAGCCDDLIVAGENGWIVDPTDSSALGEALHKALEHPDREQLGARARQTVAPYTPERLASGIVGARRSGV